MNSSAERRKMIFFAEDDEALRYAVATYLRREGYQVIEAGDGLDALNGARDHLSGIDVLVTDLTMPHLTGRGLADALRVQRPQLPVLFLTGAPIESVMDGLGPLTAYLRKPYELADVVLKIRQLLNPANSGEAET